MRATIATLLLIFQIMCRRIVMSECPADCFCSRSLKLKQVFSVSCSALNLTQIPRGIPRNTWKLELSENNLSRISSDDFPPQLLPQLQEMDIQSNIIADLPFSFFSKFENLKEVILTKNKFKDFPTNAFTGSSLKIELLKFDYNQIQRLDEKFLPNVPKLFALHLGHNLIEEIDEEAFVDLSSLRLLELNDNRLSQLPSSLSKLPQLSELSLANNKIISIDTEFYKLVPNLILLEVRGNPLDFIHPNAFTQLPLLKKLILSEVKNLTDFPHLNGSESLEILRIDRCSLENIPADICLILPKLKSLDLKSNKIHELPHLGSCSTLRVLDLSSNAISELPDMIFSNFTQLHDLHLTRNRILKLSEGTLDGLKNLRTLDMSYNEIQYIHPDAFSHVEKLEDLNLGNNFFEELPSRGLNGIIHLKTFNNPNLKEFPGPENFPNVRSLVLSYAYHCCSFNSAKFKLGAHPNFGLESSLQEQIFFPSNKDFESTLNFSSLWPGFKSLSDDFLNTFTDFSVFAPEGGGDIANSQEIQCIPQPGPFLPCNDLFDWWTLRCGVWIVFLLALMGNGTVVFVLVFARTKLDVPRFLVCNLAIADFFMGIYLGFLAVVDAATLGEFRKFAIPWQWSAACQTTGFLGVLSSELSVYTLAVITMERHYAITHAMHLNKRLSLRHATYIMTVGWIFSLIMATLPLLGVSDYRKFAVCLPFETGDAWSLGYVVFLMFANGVAFTILMGCYLKMYCSIRGSQAWNSNDTRIAKRMALLVFTDLLSWFPIAFFSLTAAFGLQLVTLEEAKVLTVFILPFNSCCNPFLYAILTKQFKKDCVLICKAIEESRVTRGIGRCRNSSNFSNRQTAPNTGSLIEKSSRDGQPCICHNGLHPSNIKGKYRFIPPAERWATRYGPLGRLFSRYILCQNNSKEANKQARDDYRMRNVRRYLYNTANATNLADPEKHQRHASVSSDNFSSSRSDSYRAHHQSRFGVPLRLLKEPRRRNSWAVTRKPSQDSNLSNSRNDSSGTATSNSTATWRLSRSSFSSTDTANNTKSSFKKIALPPPTGVSKGTCAITSTTTAIISNLANIPTHQSSSTQNNTGGDSVDKNNSETSSKSQLENVEGKVRGKVLKFAQIDKSESHIEIMEEEGEVEEDELSAMIATNRPRLVRQSAFFSDEVVIEPEVCPVHGSLVLGTYDDDIGDIRGNIISDDEEEGNSKSLRKYSTAAGLIGSSTEPPSQANSSNNNPYSIAPVIVPRRLSTIVSKDSQGNENV